MAVNVSKQKPYLATWCDDCDPGGEELSCSKQAPCKVCGKMVGGIDGQPGHTRWCVDVDASGIIGLGDKRS
jgi:hypothetical protein